MTYLPLYIMKDKFRKKHKQKFKRIRFKLSTSFKGEIIPPGEAKDRSTWSRRAQRTQNPSLPPENCNTEN
jgi:hypothetical protein